MIWEMLYQSLWVPQGEPPIPREILNDSRLSLYAKGWGREGDLAVIAENADAGALGAAWCRRFTQDAPGYGFVSEDIPELGLAVMPEARGRGIGTALLGGLIELVRGVRPRMAPARKVLSLSVMRGNPVIRLYQRKGFRMISETDIALKMLLEL